MVTLALVGLGKWGKNYLTAAQLIKGCQIKYICVRSAKTAVPENYIKVVGHQQLGQFRDIDGVIIVTPAKTHFQIAKDLLSKGFNLLIEKPLTTDYEQAKILVALKQLKQVQVMVGHIYAYHPNFIKAKSLVKQMGTIERIDFDGWNQDEMPRGLSCLWEWGVHGVALAYDLLDKLPTVTNVRLENNQKIKLVLEFEGKTKAYLVMGWSYPERRRQLTIKGSKKSVVIDLGQEVRPSLLIRELKEFVRVINQRSYPKTDIRQGLVTVKVLSDAESLLNQRK